MTALRDFVAELMELEGAAVETLERRGLITSRVEGRRVQLWLGHPGARQAVSPR